MARCCVGVGASSWRLQLPAKAKLGVLVEQDCKAKNHAGISSWAGRCPVVARSLWVTKDTTAAYSLALISTLLSHTESYSFYTLLLVCESLAKSRLQTLKACSFLQQPQDMRCWSSSAQKRAHEPGGSL